MYLNNSYLLHPHLSIPTRAVDLTCIRPEMHPAKGAYLMSTHPYACVRVCVKGVKCVCDTLAAGGAALLAVCCSAVEQLLNQGCLALRGAAGWAKRISFHNIC